MCDSGEDGAGACDGKNPYLFTDRMVFRPLHVKALCFIHNVAEDKDLPCHEMKRDIKKGGKIILRV